MPRFKYEMRDSAGRISSGAIDALTITEAATTIRRRGGVLLDIVPVATGVAGIMQKLRSVSVGGRPGLKDILNFTNQLAVMIKAGIGIREAIGGITQQIEKPLFKRTLQLIKADVESGVPFSSALAKHPTVFSTLYVNMIRASEASGNLGRMLERVAKYLAQSVETRRMVIGAMIYPIIIAVMAIGTTIFMLTFVLPRFTLLFAGKEALLPKPTVVLMAISRFLQNYWYVVVAGIVALAGALWAVVRTPAGREKWDRIKLHVPLFKKMLRSLYVSRGMYTMAELVSAGVPMLETISITAEVSGNIVFKNMWLLVHTSVKQGEKIAQPLLRQRLLPPNVVQMISSGEESGKLGEVMADIAEFYAQELKGAIKTMTAMIEPIMIVIMGAVVGFIAMSIILPIFKMSSLVK